MNINRIEQSLFGHEQYRFVRTAALPITFRLKEIKKRRALIGNQTLVFQIKFCGISPALRVAAKRYVSCLAAVLI